MTIKITDQFLLSVQGEKYLNKILANLFEQYIFENIPHSFQISVSSRLQWDNQKENMFRGENVF